MRKLRRKLQEEQVGVPGKARGCVPSRPFASPVMPPLPSSTTTAPFMTYKSTRQERGERTGALSHHLDAGFNPLSPPFFCLPPFPCPSSSNFSQTKSPPPSRLPPQSPPPPPTTTRTRYTTPPPQLLSSSTTTTTHEGQKRRRSFWLMNVM